MKTEMDQHDKFGTWKLVELPMGWTAISCHWVYVVKTTLDGDFEKAYAHLVAQGFTQRPRMEYYDITSPVVKFDSIGTILATANNLNCYELLQCYPTRYFRNPEGLEGLETKGFWTAASAHVLCLPSIIVQVFKVLASSEKIQKNTEKITSER